MTSLPPAEIDTLLMTVAEAIDLAHTGEIQPAYRALQPGLARAEELADEADAPGWTWELVRRYREAVAQYEETYRVGYWAN